MYASYFYNITTAADLLADVVAILTGTTDVNSLGTKCDKTNTIIYNDYCNAGWEVYDAAAGTNAQCLRAVVNDDASTYKYVVIDTNSAGYIMTKLYETWNSSTHTGTNIAYGSTTSSYSQRTLVASGARLDISASARHIFMFSLQSGVYGAASNNTPTGVFERTRLSPWDTVANAYVPVGFMQSATVVNECKVLGATGSDLTSSSAACSPYYRHGLTTTTNATTTLPCDSSKTTFKHAMYEWGWNLATAGHLGGSITDLTDVWLTTYNYGSPFDTLSDGTNTYVIWTVGNTYRFAVRRG